jgi:hypothetical protein
MKKLFLVLTLSSLLACNGNESADNEEVDLDNTDNDDTSARKATDANTYRIDSLDSVKNLKP